MSVAEIWCGEQLVGFTLKPGLLTFTLTFRNLNGTPERICFNGSEVTVTAAVFGSTVIAERTTSLPRLNAPVTAGTTIDRPKGAPL